ncbi:MAG TPA: hypothetical protein VHC01_12555 [Gaiellaceae bacterium]|jgi:hypothetical protein|nr:hypothetical protein [Gaiellaceae bacterium]
MASSLTDNERNLEARILNAAARTERDDDAVAVALERLARGGSFRSALQAVEHRFGVAEVATVERELARAVLARYERRPYA